MSTTPVVPVLTGTATVAMDAERAFGFFTESFGSWWPADYHIGQAEMADAVIEPREGGRWYERGVDGTECDWGRVLVWDPPRRLVLTWQINGHWQFDPEPGRASEIEIRFSPDGPDRTLVELEHRHLDRLVDGRSIHDSIEQGGGGWSSVLDRFAAAAESAG
jgi:uncharacterized protein YndB with AHSA1/START domain